ncbi:unnamed protein product [Kluyveromyces dobzhanskii CBS 2104]|uniref:WGS project CCBQ000000000 data, contig 00107 n=1 Tax=Kluyveromyces dobzhanskii CBS 2104 TaxID=1427455 RepID=A0A0A8KYZ6_9SACH|nr:unnamed protein product [Kluyveromyces dobzhanskii CBS 2104]
MTRDSEVLLWHTVLQRNRNYVYSCIGDFTTERSTSSVDPSHGSEETDTVKGTRKLKRRKEFQLCLATQDCVELYNVSEGTLELLGKWPVAASILTMTKLNMERCTHTILVMVTDSGNVSFWQFERDSLSRKVYVRTLANEPLSRSGIRRISPQYKIASDSQSRCVFLSGIERTKMCILTDWQRGKLVVASPVEIHRNRRVTLAFAACDVGLDNPVSVAVEVESETNDHFLSFYTMDLGLNTLMVQKEHLLEDKSINFVMQCPNFHQYKMNTRRNGGETDEDSINPFVICGYDGYLTLRDLEGCYEVSVQLPVRNNVSSTIIINGTVHKLKKDFFILMQSNHGDLYKVSIVPDEESRDPVLEISHFDTIPPSEDIHIFKSGTVFNVSEFGTSYLSQFESLGENLDKTTSYTPGRRSFIDAKTSLGNLSILDSLKSLNPLTSFHVSKSTPLTILAAANQSGSVTKLTSAVDFEELISTALPISASKIWTLKVPRRQTHSLLFLSMETSTTILKIREGTIEDFSGDSNPFITDKSSLFVGTMLEKSIIQVTRDCLLQIIEMQDGSYIKKLEWFPPAGVGILSAFCNETQLVVALTNHEICYFEIIQDSLNELQDRLKTDSTVNSIALLTNQKSGYCVLGCNDSSLQILNLQTKHPDFFTICAMQSLMSRPHSLLYIRDSSDLKIHIGLKSGVYMFSKLNINDGTVFDVRTKFVGTKPVAVSLLDNIDMNCRDDEDDDEDEEEENGKNKLQFNKETSAFSSVVILNSSVSWITYEVDGKITLRPINTSEGTVLRDVGTFITDNIKSNGCCSITTKGKLIIGKLENFLSWGNWLNQEKFTIANGPPPSSTENSNDEGGEEDEKDEDDEMEEYEKFRYLSQKIVQDVTDPSLSYVISKTANNETILSAIRDSALLTTDDGQSVVTISKETFCNVCSCNFGTNLKYLVFSTHCGKLIVVQVRVKNNILQTQIVHKTTVNSAITAMVPFGDKLACCLVGNIVLYALGKKQLLKRSISAMPPHITQVTAIDQWEGEMLAIGDIRESVTIFKYNSDDNSFIGVADDIVKRHVTAFKFIDSSSVIGGDKFGNCWVLRINYESNSRVAPNIRTFDYFLETICHMYVNDTPMQFQIVKEISMSDRPAIIWVGLQGTVGCFVPLLTRKEQQLFQSFQSSFADLDVQYFQDNYKPEEADVEETEGALDETYRINRNTNQDCLEANKDGLQVR